MRACNLKATKNDSRTIKIADSRLVENSSNVFVANPLRKWRCIMSVLSRLKIKTVVKLFDGRGQRLTHPPQCLLSLVVYCSGDMAAIYRVETLHLAWSLVEWNLISSTFHHQSWYFSGAGGGSCFQVFFVFLCFHFSCIFIKHRAANLWDCTNRVQTGEPR